MARQARFILGGQPHLVAQEGHNGAVMAADAADRQRWLERLRDAAATHRVAVHAWGLGPQRFALVLTPPSAQALSRMMQTFARRYAAAFNARHGRTGTLFNSRYRVSVLEEGDWVLAAMLWAEALGMPGDEASTGPSSGFGAAHAVSASSRAHYTGTDVVAGLTAPRPYWALGNTPFEREGAYRARADLGLSLRQRDALASALRGGRPCGSAAFVAGLQAGTALVLVLRSPGRPRRGAARRKSVPNSMQVLTDSK